ncbi:cadherin repeat domain-containing protein, partial [Phytobacter diazotrophicus]
MKPRQYTLSTGKTRISLQAGQTNIHKAAPGESYRVLKRQGENDQEKLADDVVASRHGQDLQLDYADGTTVTLQGWYTESDTSVTLPADGTSTQVITPGSTEGAALSDGSHVLYAHGSPDALASMTSGHPGLEGILAGLHDGSVVTGHPVTYLPQSHSYAGYIAGALGLGGVVGVAAASGGHGGHDKGGDNNNNGGGETPVQNAVQLNFVGGPALSSNDLKVEIYQADGKTLIGTGTLGADGSVTVSAGSYSGVVIVKLINSGSAADYLDEATGAGKDLSAQLWSMGVISGNNSTLVLNVNVLTTLAYTKAQEALGGTPDNPATLSATQVTDTATAISNLFGVDNILNTTVTATNGGSFDAADGLSAGEKYGLLLAAFSGAEANAGATTQTILDTVAAGITLGSTNNLSDGAQSLLIKGAATASDASGGVSLIIDTHAPVFSSATTASVDENIGAGKVVWTAVATDPSQFSYSLGTTGDSALFSINASTGAVTLTGNPDYESKASYSFTVVATDAAGNASSQTVTLAVNNLDEVAPSFTTGNSTDSFATATVSVAENTANSTAIYTAQAFDNDAADGGEHVTYSLIDADNGADAQYFTIDAATGAVTFKASPDFEGTHAPAYTFIVAATDAAGHVTTQTVTVNVTDVDEIAPTVTLDGSSTGPVMLSPATGYIYPNGFDTTALGDGSFLVTWAGNNNGSYGIYAQRLSAQGVAMGDPVQLASGATNTYSNALDSVISVTAINDAGAYAVAWTGKNSASTDSSIYTQLFNADGSPISAAVKLDGAASAQDIAPQIATLTDGSYIVTWYINGGGVYVQRFDDAGVAVGNTVPLIAQGSSNNASPQVTVLDSGSYVVTWQGQTSGDYHIYVQQFDATGTPSTPVVLDASTGNSTNYETLPQITSLANGGYVVTWSGYNYSNSNYNSSTYVQQFDANGARVGSIVELNGASNANFGSEYTYPYVAALTGGGYAITWMEYTDTNGSDDYTVFVQQFSAGGSKVGATVQLDASHNNTSNNYDELPRITALGDGGYVVTWMSLGSSNWDVNVQKFDASGGLVGGVVQLQASSGATDLYPQVTAVGTNGEYMVTWYGYASGISGYHLFVQKFNADGSTHENLVVLNHDGHATVQSTESGTIYLVNDNVVVSQLSDITGAASNQWASTTVTANTSATISAANLAEGTYHAYAVDAAGNLSVISGRSVLVDNTVPVFTSAATAADITDSTAVGDTVYTAAATDAHGVTYSLSDTQHFRINTSTGVVTLLSSPASATGAQFTVTATDAAGNQTTHTVTYNVVDTTPPAVTLTRDVDGVENSSQTVTVQSTEAGTVYLVSDSVT